MFAGLLLPGTLLALSGVLAFSFVAVVFFLLVFAWCFFLAASVGEFVCPFFETQLPEASLHLHF